MFRVRKSNHSKKIVKQLKREYKEDLEKSGNVKQEIKSGVLAARVKSAYIVLNCCTLVTECGAGLGFSIIFMYSISTTPFSNCYEDKLSMFLKIEMLLKTISVAISRYQLYLHPPHAPDCVKCMWKHDDLHLFIMTICYAFNLKLRSVLHSTSSVSSFPRCFATTSSCHQGGGYEQSR